jgi:competence ComEA-like helix-hairpin-helix protein
VAAAADVANKLDVNTATKEELKKIPGIGDSLSDAIIAGRPYRSADELKKVKGIGSGKRYEQVRAYFQ